MAGPPRKAVMFFKTSPQRKAVMFFTNLTAKKSGDVIHKPHRQEKR
jgi:hypothetical protein